MSKLKIKTAWIRNERAQHKRELGNPMSSKQQQAEAYARWLLARDGVEYDADTLRLSYTMLKINGRRQQRFHTYHARQHDGSAYVAEFPHWAFVQPEPMEYHDELIAA